MAHIGLAAMSSRRWDLPGLKNGAIFHLKKAANQTNAVLFYMNFFQKIILGHINFFKSFSDLFLDIGLPGRWVWEASLARTI